jgi:CheY-like chemotaxis protein
VLDAPVTELRRGDGQLILLADDNASVLEALSTILENANYRVLSAVDGEEALRLFCQHGDKLDMAILDMVMPKASGMQAARHMSRARDGFPAVLMTGYDKQGAMVASPIRCCVSRGY